MTVDEAIAHLNAPYDPVKVIRDLLEHAVYDVARSDECYNAVQNALGYIEENS